MLDADGRARVWVRHGRSYPGPSSRASTAASGIRPGGIVRIGVDDEPKDEEQEDSPTQMEDAEERPAKHAQGLGIHPSHRISVRSIWAWCRNCGSASRGERYKGLKQPCHMPTTAGKHTLARIKQGKAPHKGCEWGDEA